MSSSSYQGPRFSTDYEYRSTLKTVRSSHLPICKSQYDHVPASQLCTVHLYLPFVAYPSNDVRSGIEWKMRLGGAGRAIEDVSGTRIRKLEPTDVLYGACWDWWEDVQGTMPDIDQLKELITTWADSEDFISAVDDYTWRRYRSDATVPSSVTVYLDEWKLKRIEDVPEALAEKNRRDALCAAIHRW